MEVSAATGEGIDEAIESMLRLALKAQGDREQPLEPGKPVERNEELNFHERYSPREEPICCFRPVPRWFK